MNINLGPTNKKRRGVFGRRIIFLIFIIFVLSLFLLFGFLNNKKISINSNLRIEKGDSMQPVYNKLSFIDKTFLKLYLVLGNNKLNIKPGFYNFTGSLSKKVLIDRLNKGPKKSYENITILEGWNKYDIDYKLFKDELIKKDKYISFVSSGSIVNSYKKRYDFLSYISKSNNLESLEGFLYPDTYKIDTSKSNYIDQLVYLQLENFKKKVWEKHKNSLKNFNEMSFYDLLKLASIVEREEKLNKNKPLVAGILINRLNKNMRIGADITLCYGLKKPYFQCKDTLTYSKLNDSSNQYNTRARKGLVPTPIGNPSLSSINAVLNYRKSDYLYYLHDKNGNIYPSVNLQQHNFKKSKYLNN